MTKPLTERVRYYARSAGGNTARPIAQLRPGSLLYRRLMAYKAGLNALANQSA